MATEASRQVPAFYAWCERETEALGLDGLSPDLDWSEWALPFVFPPFSLTGAVLRRAVEDKVDRMLVVLPWHTSYPWFPLLLELLLDVRKLRCI